MLRLPGAYDGKSLQPYSAYLLTVPWALSEVLLSPLGDPGHQGSRTAGPLPNTCHRHTGPLIAFSVKPKSNPQHDKRSCDYSALTEGWTLGGWHLVK